MCNCAYCLDPTCAGSCPAPLYPATPWEKTVTGTFDVAPLASCASACDCPADDYLTTIRVMAAEVEMLQSELDTVKETLQCVLDHVKWDSIPECLVEDIDAIFDGNTEDGDA